MVSRSCANPEIGGGSTDTGTIRVAVEGDFGHLDPVGQLRENRAATCGQKWLLAFV
jgi:hypothetical protein